MVALAMIQCPKSIKNSRYVFRENGMEWSKWQMHWWWGMSIGHRIGQGWSRSAERTGWATENFADNRVSLRKAITTGSWSHAIKWSKRRCLSWYSWILLLLWRIYCRFSTGVQSWNCYGTCRDLFPTGDCWAFTMYGLSEHEKAAYPITEYAAIQ